MSRLMSVAFTEDAVRELRKTVTRRKGWLFLKPGDRLTLCRKVMGRKPGEPLERIADVEVVSVRREPLSDLYREIAVWGVRDEWIDYGPDEVIREGFPGMDPVEFVTEFFIRAQGMRASDDVTRIEWRYLAEELGPDLPAPGRTPNADSRPLSATGSAETPSQVRVDDSGSPDAGDSLSGGPR